MLLRAVAVLAIAAPAHFAAAQDLAAGKVFEKVECREAPGQTYALYIPPKYDPARAWPILYAFDAAARGQLAVERFREAAGKYGYIVAGSNNSRNGPMEPVIAAMKAMWNDTQSRFNIDPKRVYTTGFSGGARVAIQFATPTSSAGVIACGAAFPQGAVPKSLPFAFFGLAGTDDFNMPEFRLADRKLDEIGVPHRIRQFEGGHDWPPAALCTEAIEWMEVEAMKSGRRTRDEALLDSLYQTAVARVETAEKAGDLYQAWLAANALAASFTAVKDVAAVQQKAAGWRDSKQVKAALKLEDQTERRQNTLSTQLQRLDVGLAADNDERTQNLSTLRVTISELQKQKSASEDSADRRAARRALVWFHIMVRDEARELLAKRDFALAAMKLEFAADALPERSGTFTELAAAYAQGGQKSKAIGALRKAVEHGARDTAAWEQDPRFEALRGDPEFRKLLTQP